ncbi:hypothetical protein AB6D11_18665 [Vibrio splendidus]
MSKFIVFGQESRQDIHRFGEWLKHASSSDSNATQYVVMYHGTLSSHPIPTQGLLRTNNRRKRSHQSCTGYVYVNLYPSMAKTFAEFSYPNQDVTVYAVKVPIADLLVDTDQLRNKRLFSGDNHPLILSTLADSLLYGSGARVKRDLDPYECRAIPPSILYQEGDNMPI